MNLIEQIQHSFNQFLERTFLLNADQIKHCSELSLNVDESKQNFGDLSSNAAMVLAKQLKQNPRALATKIEQEFKHDAISRIEIAGPGFLNIFLTDDAWIVLAQELSSKQDLFFELDAHAPHHNFNVEYVSANPTGPLHLGHGRNGIIGDVLSRVLKFLGHNVTREFYINDAGSQIQKLGQSLKVRIQQELGMEVDLPEEGYAGQYLIDLAKECVKEYGEPVLKEQDSFFQQYAQEHCFNNIKQTLEDYGITFDVWFSEKTLHESGMIDQALNDLRRNGYLYEQEGALWFKSTEFGDDKDRVVKKSSGELTYVAADAAYMKSKVERGADKMVMVLGQDHHSYVVRLNALLQAQKLDQKATLEIILYQLVSIKEGGQALRMSKRAGRIVTLEDVIETVGRDVARFFYLNRKADAHLEFDIELALKKTEENPVYYIQYAYVRVKSILEKANQEKALQTITGDDAQHLGIEEALLLKKIISLKHLLVAISHNYQTHALTYYLHELAQLYHVYYSKNRVIDLENPTKSRARLLLMGILQDTFETGLDLIGVSKPEKM